MTRLSGQWKVDSCGIPFGDEENKVLIGFTQPLGKLVFVAPKKRCHCEERSDVAIPRIFRVVRKTDKRPNEPS